MKLIITITLIGIAIFALLKGLSAAKKAKTASQFLLMNGKLNLKGFIGTMTASNLSLGNMIFVCAIYGYLFNLSGVLWVAVTIALLIVGHLVFAKHFKNYIQDRNNSGSLHEFISSLYFTGSNKKQTLYLRYFSSVVTIATLIFAIILELHIASKLFSLVFDTNVTSTFFTFIVLIAIYATTGGFRTVIHTDILQSIMLIFAIFGGLYFAFFYETSYEVTYNFKEIFNGVGWANSAGIAFLGFGWLLITMDTWQRNCASRDIDTTRNGILISGGLMILFVIIFAFFGMYVKDIIEPLAMSQGLQVSEGTFPFNDLYLLASPDNPIGIKFALAAVFIGLIMAAISTADTFFIVIGHAVTTDLLLSKHIDSFGKISESQNLFFGSLTRIVIIISSLVILIFWGILNKINALNDPLSLFYISYSVQYALIPALVLGIFLKRKFVIASIISIVAGFIGTYVIGFVFLKPYQDGSDTIYLFLRADQWIGLLPLMTFLISLIFYYITHLIKSQN